MKQNINTFLAKISPPVFLGRETKIALAVAALLLPTFAHALNPMDVNALLDKAVQTHPLVGSAMADEKAAEEGVSAAKLSFLPTPSISAGHDSERGMVSSFKIRQPLWSGGQLTANVNQAIYDNKAATAYVHEQKNTVAKNTIDIWQNYIYSIALQDLYVQNLARLSEFEAMMKRRVKQGVSAKIELDLVTNRILQDQHAFQAAQEQEKIAAARLEQMIGEPVNKAGQTVPLAMLVRYAKEQSANFSELAFSDISQGNPSVIRQKFAVESARQQVKSQQAARYPKLYAQYEHSYYHREDDHDGQFSWGMSYDPGAGFSNIALERASQARVQSLAQTAEAARRTAMEAIQTQYQQFVSSRDQELSLTTAVAGAQIVVNSYQRQFIAGRKSWLEVLNAVKEQSQYQQQLLQTQSQMVSNFYKLQVDFGLMPWQDIGFAVKPTEEFHPYLELSEWLKYQSKNVVESFYEPTILNTKNAAATGDAPQKKTNVVSDVTLYSP